MLPSTLLPECSPGARVLDKLKTETAISKKSPLAAPGTAPGADARLMLASRQG
jgi:hypothetical protein